MSLVTACSRVLLNIYLFIYIYYTPNGGTGVGLGGGVRLGEGRQENKHFMNKQLSLTHERKERWTDECDWMDETLCCGVQVTFFSTSIFGMNHST